MIRGEQKLVYFCTIFALYCTQYVGEGLSVIIVHNKYGKTRKWNNNIVNEKEAPKAVSPSQQVIILPVSLS